MQQEPIVNATRTLIGRFLWSTYYRHTNDAWKACGFKIGNLRTTTKFTTTMSVDWQRTGTRTSVSAGKRKLKMQSVGRSTTTTLNVNTNVKLWCSFATKFFGMASFKTMQDLFFFSVVRLISLTMKNFLCCLTFSSGKTPAFRTKIIHLSTWMRWPSPSVCQSLDLEKETFWCDSCFPYKVYFLYIKDIWFVLPKYVQINLSLTSLLARPPQLLSFFEVKTIHYSNFKSTSLVRRKKEGYLDLWR